MYFKNMMSSLTSRAIISLLLLITNALLFEIERKPNGDVIKDNPDFCDTPVCVCPPDRPTLFGESKKEKCIKDLGELIDVSWLK